MANDFGIILEVGVCETSLDMITFNFPIMAICNNATVAKDQFGSGNSDPTSLIVIAIIFKHMESMIWVAAGKSIFGKGDGKHIAMFLTRQLKNINQGVIGFLLVFDPLENAWTFRASIVLSP